MFGLQDMMDQRYELPQYRLGLVLLTKHRLCHPQLVTWIRLQTPKFPMTVARMALISHQDIAVLIMRSEEQCGF